MTAAEARPRARAVNAASEAAFSRQLALLGIAVFGVFLVSNVAYPFKRPDYYLLADAFLHGRTWIDANLMPTNVDLVHWQGHVYLPFGPGPALPLIPLVALLGPMGANAWQAPINAVVAAVDVTLLLVLVRRVEPRALPRDLTWVAVLLALSTPLWWITLRTGPWHFAQLIAIGASLVAMLELLGPRRAWIIGLALGFALMARLTLAAAVPFVAWYLYTKARGERQWSRARGALVFLVIQAAAVGIIGAYNGVRFGSPLTSGYGLSDLPPFLAALRAHGLFSLAHIPGNLNLLLFHLPVAAPAPFFLRPDGLGLTIALAGPGLFLMAVADWSRPLVRWAALTGLVVLVPSLLYYGGGWIQLGFRYMLDALPFIAILVASAIRRPLAWWWKVLIVVGVLVNLWGVAWSYTLYLQ